MDEALRDCFVNGLHSDAVQHKLLSEKVLTSSRSISMELASKSTMEFSGHREPHQVNALTNDTGTKQPCYGCGGKHPACDCKFKSKKVSCLCKSRTHCSRLQE